MKIKEFCKKNQKKVIVISVSLVTVLVITAGTAVYCLRKGGVADNFFMPDGNGGFAMMEGAVSASGVTSVGMTQENFEVENLETELQIEEVCVSSGEEIEAGTKILKLSDESVAEARKELQDVVTETELAYRTGVIEYEKNKITAKYDYDTAVLAGEQSEAVYDEAIAGLEANVEKAEEELQEAKEQIAEYEAYVNDDSYREHFQVDEYQALYDENLKLLTDKMEEWGVDWSQLTGGSGNPAVHTTSELSTVSSGDAGGNTGSSQYVTVLSSLYSVLEQNLKDLEQAQSDYEAALANAKFELQTLQLNLPSLEQAVAEAQEAYETQILEEKLTYETSLANAKRAQSDYETALEKAESDYEDLKDKWEDAKENLTLFENSVGDGYYHASGAGTILRTMVRAEQTLLSDSTIFVYSNPDEMTATVAVDQSDIADISIGDTATVMTGTVVCEGTVTQINPVTSSDSRTSVAYQVTVTLTGNIEELSTNQSVTVLFGEQMPENEQTPSDMPNLEKGEREQNGNHEKNNK